MTLYPEDIERYERPADEPTEADPQSFRPGQIIRHRDGDEYILVERKTGPDAHPLPGWWLRKLEPPHRLGLADRAWEAGEWALVGGRPAARDEIHDDRAHNSPHAAEVGHRSGFCLACAEIRAAVGGVAAGPQATPRVLWEGETRRLSNTDESEIYVQLAVAAGTRVRVVAAPTSQEPPTRPCCGQPHTGAECPDGLVMCCLCFDRVPKDRLHLLPNGAREDVCETCAHTERRAAPTGQEDHHEETAEQVAARRAQRRQQLRDRAAPTGNPTEDDQ